MKVLLISLQRDLDTIGIKFIHYYLLGNNHQSSILFIPDYPQNNPDRIQAIRRFLKEFNPGLVGISLMSIEYYFAQDISLIIREELPGVPLVWGGIHPTISPDNCLDSADYACVGEGELTILEMADAIQNGNPLNAISNLVYKQDGQIYRNPLAPLINNLDEVPSYDHISKNSYLLNDVDVVPLDEKVFRKYARNRGATYSLMSSRGCPFSCTYCCNNFFNRLYDSNKIRRRSIEHIMQELEQALKDNPFIEFVNFQDDCFIACPNDYLEEFCRIYKERIDRPFVIRAIPTYLNPNKLESLKKAGVSWISLGLQSGSDRTNKEVFKRRSVSKDFLKAAWMIHDFKIAAFYDVILDNPFETEEDQIHTVETLMETPKPFYPDFFSLTFYYGTELRERALKECPDCIEDPQQKDYFIPHKSDLNQMIRLAAFMDKRYMEKVLNMYRKNPNGVGFRLVLTFLKYVSPFTFEPVTYFEVTRLSLGGSFWKTFKILPNFFKEGFRRYWNQFRGKKAVTNPS